MPQGLPDTSGRKTLRRIFKILLKSKACGEGIEPKTNCQRPKTLTKDRIQRKFCGEEKKIEDPKKTKIIATVQRQVLTAGPAAYLHPFPLLCTLPKVGSGRQLRYVYFHCRE